MRQPLFIYLFIYLFFVYIVHLYLDIIDSDALILGCGKEFLISDVLFAFISVICFAIVFIFVFCLKMQNIYSTICAYI